MLELSLPASNNIDFHIKDYSKLVLFFYPKNNTPVCTSECKQFALHYHYFLQLGFEVFGVSNNNIESHKKFITKFKLPFNLLSDINGKGYKLFKLKKFILVERASFVLINGVIVKQWNKVKVQGHVKEVLDFIESI